MSSFDSFFLLSALQKRKRGRERERKNNAQLSECRCYFFFVCLSPPQYASVRQQDAYAIITKERERVERSSKAVSYMVRSTRIRRSRYRTRCKKETRANRVCRLLRIVIRWVQKINVRFRWSSHGLLISHKWI